MRKLDGASCVVTVGTKGICTKLGSSMSVIRQAGGNHKRPTLTGVRKETRGGLVAPPRPQQKKKEKKKRTAAAMAIPLSIEPSMANESEVVHFTRSVVVFYTMESRVCQFGGVFHVPWCGGGCLEKQCRGKSGLVIMHSGFRMR